MDNRAGEMEVFVLAAELKSFSAAGRKLRLSPSAVSKLVTRIEDRLGARLLVRTTRRLELTPEGEVYLGRARRILSEIAETERIVAEGAKVVPRGPLRVNASVGFGERYILPLLPAFLALYPDIELDLTLTDGVIDVIGERTDVAIRSGPLRDSSLKARKLLESRKVVIASPDYLARHGTPQHPSDLARHNCLSFGVGGNQARGWLFNVDGKTTPQRVSGTLECTDGAVLHAWTLDARGLAWRSLWEVEDDLRLGRLVTVLDEFAAPPNAIYAVYPQRKHLPLRVRVFVDLLRQSYADRLP